MLATRLPGAGCLRVDGSYQSLQLCAAQPLLRRMRASHSMHDSSASRSLASSLPCVAHAARVPPLEELAVMRLPGVVGPPAMLHQTSDRLPQCPPGLRDVLP